MLEIDFITQVHTGTNRNYLERVVELRSSARSRERPAQSRNQLIALPRAVEQCQQPSTERILIAKRFMIETWNNFPLTSRPARRRERLGPFARDLDNGDGRGTQVH